MRLVSRSVDDTLKIGKKISKNLENGDIVCLFGKLGSGKTILTKGIAAGLGIKKNKIISPTFVLIRQYRAKIPLYHFDLYRLDLADDILALGYEEYLYDEAITVIEWADRLKDYLPKEHLRVKIRIGKDNIRMLDIQGCGKRYEKKLQAFK